MNMRQALAVRLVYAGSVTGSCGVSPESLLVLVNKNSPRSAWLANEYVRRRGIPAENVVYLPLPKSVLEPPAEITPEDFSRFIWEPAQRIIRERGLKDRILAWAYSLDFPVRILTDPQMSLQGLTFLRNKVPAPEAVREARYRSPLFAGPDGPNGPVFPSRDFEWLANHLREGMPLPSMLLGFMGSRGNEESDLERFLDRAVSADYSRPEGAVYFVTNNDVRSTCRAWQYPAVVSELRELGVRAEIVPAAPDGSRLLGLLTGSPWPNNAFAGGAEYVPGCMIEHLTSAAGYFHHPEQTKLSWWIQHGAAGTAGTVIEPMALWPKFPSARFFTHYANGGAMIESFFLSLGSPLQALVVGDPLCRPWAPKAGVNISRDAGGSAILTFTFSPRLPTPDDIPNYLLLLDGRPLDRTPVQNRFSLNTSGLSDGFHELRALLFSGAPPRYRASGLVEFEVKGSGRRVLLEGLTDGASLPVCTASAVLITASEGAKEVGLLHNGRRVLTGRGHRLSAPLDPESLGLGPVRVQPYALYPGDIEVRGAPIAATVVKGAAPAIREVEQRESDGWITLAPVIESPDGCAVETAWLQEIPFSTDGGEEAWKATGGEWEVENDVLRRLSGGDLDVRLFAAKGAPAPREIRTDLAVTPGQWAHLESQILGLVFNYRNARNFHFFGLFADTSAWVMGRCRNGRIERIVSRGRAIRPERWYRISVRTSEAGLEGWLGDERLCTWPQGRLEPRPVGVMAGKAPAWFRGFGVSPPPGPRETVRISNDTLELQPSQAGGLTLLLRARTPGGSVEQRITP